ncbi:MAG: tetratricopeptide repeat protein [Armatimonadota bacterium]
MRVVVTALLALVLVTCAVAAAETDLQRAVGELKAGRAAEAAKLLSAVVQAEPDNLAARFWHGRAQLEIGQVQQAAATLRHVIGKKPDSVDARYWLGVALEKMGDVEGAKGEWVEVLRQQPAYAPARQALARLGGDKTLDTASATALARVFKPVHSRVIVNVGDSGVDIGSLDLLSRNVLDYTFSEAPTDWYVAAGSWGTTNRWTCSPQWSWFGGIAELAPVVVWNKRSFTGDITVDMYIAWGMIYGHRKSYKNPNDLNISLCANGTDLFSGYTFVVGGWQNQRTAILKEGRVLAETSETWALPPVFEDNDPGTYEHHRKWWGIRARKTGNRLQLYFDNKLALEAVDPNPLQEGRVALWGYDNRIILSRVRLYCQDPGEVDSSLPAEKWATRQQLSVEGEAPPELSAASTLGSDFEASVKPLRQRQNSFTQVTLAVPGADGKGRCLKLINNGPGGTFGVDLSPQSVDLAKQPLLSFDYKLSPEAKINLYCAINDKLYEVGFSGRQDPAPLAQYVGAIPDVKADGEWHHAEVDLLGMMRKATGAWTADSLVAADLWLGNLNERDYLLAGLGGNQAGTVWYLDNLYLSGPSPKVTVSPPNAGANRQIKSVAWEVSQDPAAEPKREAATPPAAQEVAPGKSGWWWVHAAAQLADDTWLPTARVAVPIDAEPPQARLISPVPGAVAGDEDIVIVFDDQSPGAIDWRTVTVTIAQKTFKPGDFGVTVEPEFNRLVVDPGEVGLVFEAGKPVELAVAAGDTAGNKPSAEQKFSFTYAPQQDKRGPRVASVTVGRPYLVDADFEQALPPMESYSGEGGAVLTLDKSTAASGQGSLCLSNPTEWGRYGVRLVTEPFDAGIYRLVSFDYRIPPHYRGDFAVYVNGDWRAIKFTDSDTSVGYMGKVENVVADDQWHHAEFNLYDMLVAADPRASSYIVRWFVLSDWGSRMSNFRRRTFWLDNLQIVPVSSSLEPLKVSVAAGDPGGLGGVAWLLDQLSVSAAPRNVQADSATFEVPATGNNGQWWMHCRVADKAGNLSRGLDRRVLLDGERPFASLIGPADGGRAADSEVLMSLADRGIAGIDPSSIVLEVAGQKYTCENSGLVYDASERKLTWNCEKVQPEPVVFKDGQAVSVRLARAADYTGNESEDHPAWSWTMDYRMDHTAPSIAAIDSPTHRTFMTQTFEEGLGEWATREGGSGAKVELAPNAGPDGSTAVRLTQITEGALMQAYATTNTFFAEAYPMIALDYNIQPGAHLDLMLLCNGKWFAVALTDNPAGAIGRVPNVVADSKWHHASVNIFALLRRHIEKGSLAVSQIIISDRNSADNPVGATALFDNFVIGQIGSGTVKLAWQATDATGIQGFSYVVDRKGGTEPDTQPETVERVLNLSKLENGLWYLHVRAYDGAGNWGPASHYAVLNGGAG